MSSTQPLNPSSKKDLRPADRPFIDHLKIGDRLFHFPAKTSTEKSSGDSDSAGDSGYSRNSDSAEDGHSSGYTLYTVVGLPDEEDVTVMKAFDEKETRKNFSRSVLLSTGDWWYNPQFDHVK